MAKFEFLDHDPRTGTVRGRADDPIIPEFVGALRANPERWAKYPRQPKNPASAGSLASRIRDGQVKPFRTKEGRFEAVSRDGDVYVRYMKDDVE
jgi:hypothetical protein